MRPTTCLKRPVKFSHYHGANVTLTDQYKRAVGEYTQAQGQFMLSENLRPGDRFEFDLHGAGIVKIQGFASKNEAQSWFRSKQPLGRGCIRIRTQKTLRYSVSVPPQSNEITLISKTGKRQDQLAGSILAFDIECGDVQVILFKSSNVTFDTINQSKHVEVSNTLRNCTATLKHYNPLALCTPLNCSLKPGKIFILKVKGPENDRATGSYVRICVAGQPSLYCNQGDEKCVGTSQCPQVKGKRLTARANLDYEYILRVEDNAVSVERCVREPKQQINLIEMLPASGTGECALWFELHRVSIELSEYRVKDDFDAMDSPPNYPAPPPPIHPARTLRRPNQGTGCYHQLWTCQDDHSSMASSSSSHHYISIQVGDETSSYISADSETNRSFEEQDICHKMAFSEVRPADLVNEYGMNFNGDDSEYSSEPPTLTNTENNEAGPSSDALVYDPNHFGSDQRSRPMPIAPKPHYGRVSRDQCHISCGTLPSEKCHPSFGYETPGELIAPGPTRPGASSITKKQSCPEQVLAGASPLRLRAKPVRSKSFSPGNHLQLERCGTGCTRDPFYPARADASKTEQCRRWLASVNYSLGSRSPPCSEYYGERTRSPGIDENILSVSQVNMNSDEGSSFWVDYNGSPESQPTFSHNIHLEENVANLQRFSGATLATGSIDMTGPPAIPPRSSNYVNGKLTACPAKVKSESDICVACSRKSETCLKNVESGSLCSSSPSEMSIDEETFAKVPRHRHQEPSRASSFETAEDGDETFAKLPFQNELSKESEDSGCASSVQIRDRKITGRNIVESSNINDQPTPPPAAECVAVLQPSPVVILDGGQGGFQRSNTYRRNMNTPTPPSIKKSYPSKRDLGK
ncbi:unnamed protein product [Lymnaea stagnalis]|uniref:CABIT domain-containing protein n=1 Tax=Lymnaea stagnalis TaxID=6523 RepID=A0AAV2H9C4_LYMST